MILLLLWAFTDPAWGVALDVEGLKPALGKADPAVLFEGKAGAISVTVTVHEAARTLDEWKKLLVKGKPDAEKGHRFYSRELRYGVFDVRHGRALFVRGRHCFEVHAWGEEIPVADLEGVLDAFSVEPDPGFGLRARRIAKQRGKPDLDPHVMLEAGLEYLRHDEPALAAGLLVRASRLAEPETFEPEQRQRLLRAGGRALLLGGQAGEAIAWLREAEKTDDADKRRDAAYELARACSVAEKLDDGFAALDRAFDGGMPVSKGVLSHDKLLGNLRKDPRWEDFWRARVR